MSALPSTAVIGAGLGGLCVGIHLKQAGCEDFVMLEAAEAVGGTWRQNTYPGCACDVPIPLYAFSFAPSLHWRHFFPRYDEMQEYSRMLVDQFGLAPHLRLNEGASRAEWDEARQCWRITSAAGQTYERQVLAVCLGQLNRPQWPDIPGLESFAGPKIHSAAWDHGVSLAGKRVGIVGSAASGVQIIPVIAEQAGHLTVFQRSANWLLPRNDREITEAEKRIAVTAPKTAQLTRDQIYWNAEEIFWQVFDYTEAGRAFYTELSLKHLEAQVSDPELRRKLTPDYPIGVRRILFADDYFPALQRANVALETAAIDAITPQGVRMKDGRALQFDVLVFATGFETTAWGWSMDVIGRGGQRLKDVWAKGPQAYYGMCVAGFPNMFMTYGPNTNLGHNSITSMIEVQTGYIMKALAALAQGGLASIEVTKAAQDRFNAELQAKLAKTSWADPAAGSWYKTADGRITQNWGWNVETYRAALSAVALEDFDRRFPGAQPVAAE